MKRTTLVAVTLILACSHAMHAQGVLYLSNLGESTFATEPIASDSWFATLFRTGPNPDGYELESVHLLMSAVSGATSGFDLSLYSYVGGLPGENLGSLSGDDPLNAGIFNFSGSETVLAPLQVYFLVASAETSVATGAYHWNRANTLNYLSADGWEMSTGYYYSNDGLNWFFSRTSPMQLSIYATPIPEPSSSLLLLIGGITFAAHHAKRNKSKLPLSYKRRAPPFSSKQPFRVRNQ